MRTVAHLRVVRPRDHASRTVGCGAPYRGLWSGSSRASPSPRSGRQRSTPLSTSILTPLVGHEGQRRSGRVSRPGHREPMPASDEGLDVLADDLDAKPQHVVRFGSRSASGRPRPGHQRRLRPSTRPRIARGGCVSTNHLIALVRCDTSDTSSASSAGPLSMTAPTTAPCVVLLPPGFELAVARKLRSSTGGRSSRARRPKRGRSPAAPSGIPRTAAPTCRTGPPPPHSLWPA
jgi:hypothetical protein